MKRLIGLISAALFVCLPLVVTAGDYHSGATLTCSDCHVMHYSQSHGYNADGSGSYTALGGSGPYEYLLRNDINDLCLTCHDASSSAPDVYGANTGTAYVRQAGALNKDGDGNEYTGHTLNSGGTAPGSNPAWSEADGLNCANCHQPHGYHPQGNSWRNLYYAPGNLTFPGVLVDYTTGTQSDTTTVYQVASTPMTTHYATSNVWFNEPDPTKSDYAGFCQGCHTDFHGAKGSINMGGATGVEWLRHPAADANIGAYASSGHSVSGVYLAKTNKVKVMAAGGNWATPTNATPSCMTCHKAHGNGNAFSLIYMSGTGTVTEQGDAGTTAKQLCKQCHVQG